VGRRIKIKCNWILRRFVMANVDAKLEKLGIPLKQAIAQGKIRKRR
jgi:hypothetical protein